MAQEQSQKSGEPPIGECAVCAQPVTATDPGLLTFSPTSGAMAHVHTRCKPGSGGGATDVVAGDAS